MLGHDITRVFSGHEVIAYSRKDFNITDLDQSLSAIRQTRPDFLIHSAAYTDVDGSELDPEKAYRVNGIGTRNVTMACEEIKCPIIYVSSDYVFDGTKKLPYNEWDTTSPVNKYGRSKLMGERFVSSLTNRFFIVRTSWLYGKKGKNFVDTIIKLLSDRESIDVVNDQTGSPTYTLDLAVKLMELIGKGYGTYHITNSSKCTWYEFAAEIAKFRQSRTIIRPITSDQFKRPAKRPRFSALDNKMLRLEGLSLLRPWQDALHDYLSHSY
jgi:dTDP-4-dehydrorhamnose reductase